MTTIVLADDHQVVRQGVRALLESEPDFTVVGEAANGEEAASMVRKQRPAVLVLDLLMPGMSGVEVARIVHRACPKTRIVVLSMYATEAYVTEAFKNGASGYVMKDASSSDLVQAIRAVCDGRRYLCPPLSEDMLEAYMQRAGGQKAEAYDTLTRREREILRLVAQGMTSHQIGQKLLISSRTVEVHRRNLMRKLGVSHHTELVGLALRHGLIQLEN